MSFKIKGFKTGATTPVSIEAPKDSTPYNHKYSDHWKGRKSGRACVEGMTQATLKGFFDNPACACDPVFIFMNQKAKEWNLPLAEAVYRYMTEAFLYAIKVYEESAKQGEMIKAGVKRD